jgi:hypothetical protein
LDQVDERTRRELRTTRWLYIIWAALAVLVALAFCYFLYSMLRARAPQSVSVGPVDLFPPGSVTLRFVNADFTDPETQKDFTTLSLQVARDAAGNFTVFFARSTNPVFGELTPRQCVIEWHADTQRFVDPCGGSQWTRDGKYVQGPAPRDLDRFPAAVSNGNLEINLNLIQGAPHP